MNAYFPHTTLRKQKLNAFLKSGNLLRQVFPGLGLSYLNDWTDKTEGIQICRWYQSRYQLIPWNIDLFDVYSNKAGFPGSSVGKESACNAGDPSSIPGSGRSPGEGTGYPLQYSWASLVAYRVKTSPAMQKIWVWSLGWEDPLEGGMATHSRIFAWRIPWTEEPGRLQCMGSQSWISSHAYVNTTWLVTYMKITSSARWWRWRWWW